MGRTEEAIILLEQRTTEEDIDANELVRLLTDLAAFSAQHSYEDNALLFWERALSIPEASTHARSVAMLSRGRFHFQKELFDRAAADYKEGLLLEEQTEYFMNVCRYHLGKIATERKQPEEAITMYSDIVEKSMSEHEHFWRKTALVERGCLFGETNEVHLAVADFTSAIAIDAPARVAHLNAFFNRGVAFLHQAMHEAAIDDFTVFLTLFEESLAPKEEIEDSEVHLLIGTPSILLSTVANAQFMRANCALELQQLPLAIQSFDAAVESRLLHSDDHRDAYERLIALLAAGNRLEDALLDAEKHAASEQITAAKRAEWHHRCAVLAEQLGDSEREISFYSLIIENVEAAVELRADALALRGATHGNEGRPGPADADYQAVLNLEGCPPELKARAYANLAGMKMGTGDVKVAEELLKMGIVRLGTLKGHITYSK